MPPFLAQVYSVTQVALVPIEAETADEARWQAAKDVAQMMNDRRRNPKQAPPLYFGEIPHRVQVLVVLDGEGLGVGAPIGSGFQVYEMTEARRGR